MRTRTIQPRVRTRTATDTQQKLFEEKATTEDTPHTIMQGVLYNRIPGMFSKVAESGDKYFMYKDHIYRKNEKMSTNKSWAGTSPDKSTTNVTVFVDAKECHRLSKQNPLVALYDFLLQRSKYQKGKWKLLLRCIKSKYF